MNKSEYRNVMRILYLRLKQVKAMSEEEAREFCESETKEEGVQQIEWIIECYKKLGVKYINVEV